MSDNYIDCFHGTTKSLAQEIQRTGKFLIAAKPHHWLGPGAYFFQDSPLHAWGWALRRCAAMSHAEPAVISLEIKLGRCLDLLDATNFGLIEKAHAYYSRVLADAGETPKTQMPPIIRKVDGTKYYFFSSTPTTDRYGNNALDNEIIKIAIEIYQGATGEEIDVVRAAFIEGTELYENSYFYDRYHIQVAIMNEQYADFGTGHSSGVRNFHLFDSGDLKHRYEHARRTHWPK